MHEVHDRPVVVDGQIVMRPVMVVALTYDHRLLDGREGTTFLGTLCSPFFHDPFSLASFPCYHTLTSASSASQGIPRRPGQDAFAVAGSYSAGHVRPLTFVGCGSMIAHTAVVQPRGT